MVDAGSQQVALAVLLCVTSVLAAVHLTRTRSVQHRSEGRVYTTGLWVRDVSTSLGMLAYGLKALLVGAGWLTPWSLANRCLLVLATVGIVGGVAASRIRRLHD